MPELPDLVYIEKRLNDSLPGKRIAAVQVKEPVVLRILLPGEWEAALVGATFADVRRHGPFLCFRFHKDVELVLHPMLAGRLKLTATSGKPGRGLCFTFELETGESLHYLDDKRMGKAYLIRRGEYAPIPKFLQQGVDILSDAFTLECFRSLLKGQRKQVRVFLMDQTKLSAVGNAYADEILFDAGIHPKTFCYQLTANEVERLYKSIRKVMQWGIEQVARAAQPIEVKVRDHMKVRNRKDQPCPVCHTTIRRAGVLGYDAFFCPKCQPAKRELFIDWS
ncbi:MAG: DNA-formamidopyrimidine glycosylase [Calditrichaeota bacterium]|nr:MAG: DNA-formamidopyrimidine glycosylase [Calditrichota bacterium]